MAAIQQVLLGLNTGTVLPNADAVLMETGDWVLMETGDRIQLEGAVPSSLVLMEIGDRVLMETGDGIELDGEAAPVVPEGALLDANDEQILDANGETFGA